MSDITKKSLTEIVNLIKKKKNKIRRTYAIFYKEY
jgi:hypothetical protein